MTIRHLLLSAAHRLKTARISEPRLEAEGLLARVLDRDTAWLLAHPEEIASIAQAHAYAKLIAARARRVPFAYLAGEKWFYGRRFLVTKDVLIPRPETELVVSGAIEAVAHWNAVERNRVAFLDLGTGSGAIGLTLAAEFPGSRALLGDISAKALAVAKKNTRSLKLARRTRITLVDLFKKKSFDALYASARRAGEKLVVAANLPYLPLATWKSAGPEVRQHEPKRALVSGRDGLDHYRALFKNLVQQKRKPDLLLLEAEPGQFETLSEMTLAVWPGCRIEILKDLHGDERVMRIAPA